MVTALLLIVVATPRVRAQDTSVVPASEIDNLQAISTFQVAIGHNKKKLDTLRKDSPEYVAQAAKLAKSYEGLGVAYIRGGRYSEAIPALTSSIDLSHDVIKKDNINAVYSRALAYNRSGRAAEAIYDFKNLLKLKDDPLYHEELAVAYINMGNKEAALEQYEILLQARPNDAWFNFQVGYLLAEKGSYAESARAYEKAVAGGSQLPQSSVALAYNNLGDAYYHLCEREKTIAAFKKAAELNPDFAENLGAAYLLRC